MASGSITSWLIDGGKLEIVTDFIFSSVQFGSIARPCGLLEDLDDLVGRDKEGILRQIRPSPERGRRRRCWWWGCFCWQRRSSYGRVCHRGRRKIRSTRVEVQTTRRALARNDAGPGFRSVPAYLRRCSSCPRTRSTRRRSCTSTARTGT